MTNSQLFHRTLLTQLTKWMDRKEIFAIKGPRQSGKTTLLELLHQYLIKKGVREDHIIKINFEDRDEVERFMNNHKQVIQNYILDNKRYYFLMDEYQYVPDGGQKLKLLFDIYGEKVKFIITGSSSLELVSKMGKYLVGRVFQFNLFPLSFYEFLLAKDKFLAGVYLESNKKVVKFLQNKNAAFDKPLFYKKLQYYFKEYITYGGYPAVVKARTPEEKKLILKNILELFISRDIIELLKITDAFKFRNFVRVLATRSGGLVNYDELSSTCQSYYREVKRWMSVLYETYIIHIVRPFYKNLSAEIRKMPKIYFYDIGLRNYLLNNFSDIEQRSDAGAIVENFILLSLMHTVQDAELDLKFWRTQSGSEVDFIIRGSIPVEVKYSRSAKVTRSFRSFLDAYKPKRGVITTIDKWSKQKIRDTVVGFIPIYYF